jgi:hypothetical protein
MGLTSQNLTVSGKVTDKNNVPIDAAEVLLLQNNIVAANELTDENGNFTLQNLIPNSYLLQIRQLGDTLYFQNINVTQNIDLGTITAENAVKNLQEVTVTGQKKLIERKVDRLVFNVENSILASGGDALDALKVTPGIRLQNDQISMIGKSGMSVMMNDRILQLSGDDLINYLKSIPSDNISKIEVITTPPAKYDAEGNSGIVNIVIKKTLMDSWKTILRSMYQQATYATFSHGAGLSYNKNKFSTLIDVSYQYGKKSYTNTINYWYPEEYWKNNVIEKRYENILGTLLSLQYKLSKTNSIGFQYQGSFSYNKTNEFNLNRSYYETELLKNYKTSGISKTNPENISFNLNYNQKLDTLGKKFTVDLDYLRAFSERKNNFTSIMENSLLGEISDQTAGNNARQSIQNYSLKFDFEIPYKWVNISFGAKASFTFTKNMVDSRFYDTENSNLIFSQFDNFEYAEIVQAIYFDVTKEFGEKLETKIGLRGENTKTHAKSISTNQVTDRHYIKLFPSAYILYNIDANNTFSASFARRLQRPKFRELNPAKWYQNPNAYVEGNPFLQPNFVYLYGLNYSYKSLLDFNINYINVKDIYGQLVYHDIPQETQIFKILNYADGKQITAKLTINYNPYLWWESSTDLMTAYAEQRPFVDILASNYSGWQGYISTQHTFLMNNKKNIFASLYYEYNFPSRVGIYEISAYSTLDLGIKYLTLNNKLSIALNIDDILKTYSNTVKIYSSGIPQSFNQFRDTRFFRISFTYNFGNDKIKIYQRKIGNTEEKNRSN